MASATINTVEIDAVVNTTEIFADVINGGGGGGTPISTGDLIVTAPLQVDDGVDKLVGSDATVSIPKADTNTDGYLSKEDWATFNNKQTNPTPPASPDKAVQYNKAGVFGGDEEFVYDDDLGGQGVGGLSIGGSPNIGARIDVRGSIIGGIFSKVIIPSLNSDSFGLWGQATQTPNGNSFLAGVVGIANNEEPGRPSARMGVFGAAVGENSFGGRFQATGPDLTYAVHGEILNSSSPTTDKKWAFYGKCTNRVANNYAGAFTNGAVGIGTDTPHLSSELEIASTTTGLLIPRLTTTQRDAITSPATSLLVFNTTTGTLQFYTGAMWADVGAGATTSVPPLSANANLSAGQTVYFGPACGFAATPALIPNGPYTTITPRAGTLRNFYVDGMQAPGMGDSATFTIYKNGVVSGIVVTVANASTTGNDLVNTLVVAAGDRIDIEAVTTGSCLMLNVRTGIELV